ncbi:hypothetical protein BsWGS_07861 [Bradybaena similaris]
MDLSSSSSSGTPSMNSSEAAYSSQMMDGYDNEFVPHPESRYECPICLLVLREPRQTRCGHRFCRDCIIKSLRESSNRCPVDNEPLRESDIYPDNFAKREILNFNIKCPNNKDGCDKIFPLGRLQNHLEECPYALTPCPYKCASILQRIDVDSHLATSCENRAVTCENCSCNIQAKYMQSHLALCPHVIVACPHCKEQRIRAELSFHLQSECQLVDVHCPFYLLGCRLTMVRSSVDDHLVNSGASHMKQLCQAVTQMAQKLGMTHLPAETSLRDLPEHLTSMPQSTEAMSSVGLQSGSREQSCSLNNSSSRGSANSLTGLSQALLPVLGDLDGPATGHSTASINSFHDGQHRITVAQYQSQDSSSSLTSESEQAQRPQTSSQHPRPKLPVRRLNYQPIYYTAETEFWSPQPEMSRFSLQNTAPAEPGVIDRMQELASQLQLKEALHLQKFDELYNRFARMEQLNAALVKRVNDLETLLAEKDARFYNGDFYWSITHFSQYQQKLLVGEPSVLHSPPFYSSPWGYKVCVRANIDKTPDTAPNLSLFVHFMKGKNDTFLTWPFSGKITICVVDQNPDPSKRMPIKETLTANPNLVAFQRPNAMRNHKGFGYMNFLSLAAIENGTILVEDTLVIRVQVCETPTS